MGETCRWRPARTAVHFLLGGKKGTKKAPFLAVRPATSSGENLIQIGRLDSCCATFGSCQMEEEKAAADLVSFYARGGLTLK